MNSPKVTVLMPAYNAAQFLKKAVDGILNQTFTDFELLVINDGSKDGTAKILESFTDSRIRVIHQENMGVSRTLNKGLKLAKGEYIRRHDADDFSEPQMLQAQVDFLLEHPEIPMVSTQCAFMTDNDKVSFKHRQPKSTIFKTNEAFVLASYDDFHPYCPIVHGTVLCKKSVFEEFGGYRTEFLTSEDNDLWLRILDKYPIAILNQASYYLRLSASSATQTHKSSTRHYRELALSFSDERRKIGTDLLMRGEQMPDVVHNVQSINDFGLGKHFRGDILHFGYKVNLGAKDYKNVIRDIRIALQSGWKLKATYRAILFPLIGMDLVQIGVKFKQRLRK